MNVFLSKFFKPTRQKRTRMMEIFLLQTDKPTQNPELVVLEVIVNTQKVKVFVVHFYLHISTIDRVKWRGHKSQRTNICVRVNRLKKKNLKMNSNIVVLEQWFSTGVLRNPWVPWKALGVPHSHHGSFKDIQEKKEFRKKILNMFRPKFLKFITVSVMNFELNFYAGFSRFWAQLYSIP